MFNWGMKHLETVLGKTVTGIIGIFVLGIFVMWAIPKYVVTTDIFKREVESINKKMYHGDKCQELKLIELNKEYWSQKLWDLEREIEKKGTSPTTTQENRMDKAIKILDRLKEDEAKILVTLAK